MMKNVTCVPAYLHPEGQLRFDRCELIPGGKVIRLVGGLREAVISMVDQLPIEIGFRPKSPGSP